MNSILPSIQLQQQQPAIKKPKGLGTDHLVDPTIPKNICKSIGGICYRLKHVFTTFRTTTGTPPSLKGNHPAIEGACLAQNPRPYLRHTFKMHPSLTPNVLCGHNLVVDSSFSPI